MIEQTYALHLGQQQSISQSDHEAVARLQSAPINWGLEHDEDVAQFLCNHTEADNENLGSAKNYVESIDVSSFSVRYKSNYEHFCNKLQVESTTIFSKTSTF